MNTIKQIVCVITMVHGNEMNQQRNNIILAHYLNSIDNICGVNVKKKNKYRNVFYTFYSNIKCTTIEFSKKLHVQTTKPKNKTNIKPPEKIQQYFKLFNRLFGG